MEQMKNGWKRPSVHYSHTLERSVKVDDTTTIQVDVKVLTFGIEVTSWIRDTRPYGSTDLVSLRWWPHIAFLEVAARIAFRVAARRLDRIERAAEWMRDA